MAELSYFLFPQEAPGCQGPRSSRRPGPWASDPPHPPHSPPPHSAACGVQPVAERGRGALTDGPPSLTQHFCAPMDTTTVCAASIFLWTLAAHKTDLLISSPLSSFCLARILKIFELHFIPSFQCVLCRHKARAMLWVSVCFRQKSHCSESQYTLLTNKRRVLFQPNPQKSTHTLLISTLFYVKLIQIFPPLDCGK